MVIGLTGKACGGKNVVASDFEQKGWVVVDVDKLGHPVLEESHEELTKAFGPDIIRHDGKVDRKALGMLVFADEEKLRRLEAITHPRMVEACKSIIHQSESEGKDVVVLNAALLHRMRLDELCDRILFVSSPLLARYRRSKERDGMEWKRFMNREKSQKDITKRNFCPGKEVKILSNRGSLESLHRQVAEYCDTLTSKKG